MLLVPSSSHQESHAKDRVNGHSSLSLEANASDGRPPLEALRIALARGFPQGMIPVPITPMGGNPEGLNLMPSILIASEPTCQLSCELLKPVFCRTPRRTRIALFMWYCTVPAHFHAILVSSPRGINQHYDSLKFLI